MDPSFAHLRPILVILSLVAAAAVFTWRMRETNRPINTRRILIPPLGMSTGLFMFVYPPTRIPWSWGLGALACGALLFTYPLVKTSRLIRQDGHVILERSRAFLWILVGLVAIRYGMRSYVEHVMSPLQTGAIFFLVALGMIVPWRLLMYRDYRQLVCDDALRATDAL